MGIFFALWRRFFGGYDSKFNLLEKRGIQMIIAVVVTFLFEFFIKKESWYISGFVAIWTYIFWCTGHWWWYLVGNEDDSYIEEELAKGRKPALWWLVRPICKLFGFTDDRSRQYCFVGLMVRYTLYAVPLACVIGWKFYAVSFAIPFIYASMFYVELPKCRFASSPTNWAEIFSGLMIGWGFV